MTVSVAALQYALKSLWPQERVKNEVYPDHAFLAMVKKREDFYGDGMYIAVRTGDPQGRSAAFSTAQSISNASSVAGNSGAARGSRFYITRVSDYQVINLTTEAILAAKKDEGALIRSLDTEMKAGMNNIGKSLATALYRGKSGALGRIGAITANTTVSADITLANINDITSFEVGMVLVAAPATDVTAAVRSTPGTAPITMINRDLGTLRVTGDFSGTNWATASSGDFLISQGDAQNGGSAALKTSGLADWLPTTAPTAGDSFWGVDRSTDTTRLAGLRIDVSALNPEEGLMTVLSKQAREGGKPTNVFSNHFDYRNIMLSLGSKVENEYVAVGEIGFETLKVRGPKGIVAVVADQDCPAGTSYSLDMSTWTYYSLEGAPQILDLDGNQLSRMATADQFEARIVYFGNLACDAPGFNAVVTMPS